MTLRFHLRGCHRCDTAGSSEDEVKFLSNCDFAESAGFESIEIPSTNSFSSALRCAVTAGERYSRLSFRLSGNLESVLESLRGREVLDASEALNGRLIVHVRMPDEDDCRGASFRAAQEFLANLRRESPVHGTPRIDIEGDSTTAAYLAIKWADCLWLTAHRPRRVLADALPVLHFGKEVGLRLRVIGGETREEAVHAAALPMHHLEQPDHWLTHALWRNPEEESPEPFMIASTRDAARALLEYRDAGISRFLISDADGTVRTRFAHQILPLIRAVESGSSQAA